MYCLIYVEFVLLLDLMYRFFLVDDMFPVLSRCVPLYCCVCRVLCETF